MSKDIALQDILRRWLALPEPSRQTERQADVFAMQMAHQYLFGRRDDRYKLIKAYLQRYLEQC